MRILICAKHSPEGNRPIGGVQSWCRTVGAELVRLGHEVVFWQPGQRASGIFDAGIVSNYPDTKPVLRLCKKYLVISHGIIAPERPSAIYAAFTSEGVRDFWQGTGPVIKQPIDLDFWSPEELPKKYLTRFSYRDGLDFVPAIAKKMGLEFRHLKNSSPEEVREILRQSACVLATGRAALEAMACGIPVVICDHRRTYQGPLLDRDTLGSMARNYSGRGGIEPTVHNVEFAIRAAIETGSLRFHVEQNHDARVITEQILCRCS
jgi:hypothetical protein